jgi:hypothetical protein
MKKLLFLLFVLFLFSCEKEEPLFCWQCKTVVIDFNSGQSILDNWNQKICNRPESEIRRFERDQNYIVDDMRIVTYCKVVNK